METRPSFAWFARKSYAYMAERSLRSKVHYLVGLLPAWRTFSASYSEV